MNARRLPLLLLCLVLFPCTLTGGTRSTSVLNGLPVWRWKSRERKEIKEIEEKVTKDKEGFWTFETEYWVIKSEVSARFTAEAAKYMDIYYDAFQQVFYFKTGLSLQQKPVFLILRSQAAYLKRSGAPTWSGGVFCYGYRRAGMVEEYLLNLYTYTRSKSANLDFTDGKETPLSTIQHEGTHCLLAQLLGSKYRELPVWLNEGMATYYQYWDLRVKASDSGNNSRDIRARKARLARSPTPRYLVAYFRKNGNTPPNLRELLALKTQKEWSEGQSDETIGLHYALAESFADLMICSRGRRALLKTMFDRLAAGEPLLTEDEIDDLEKEWHKRLRDRWDIDLEKKKKKKR